LPPSLALQYLRIDRKNTIYTEERRSRPLSTTSSLTPHVDSASIHSLISALLRRESDWTHWETAATADVTLAILLNKKIIVPSPPKPGQSRTVSLADKVYSGLGAQ